ncbi:MAG: PAS domain S-box protein [Planctomycetota bacterium]
MKDIGPQRPPAVTSADLGLGDLRDLIDGVTDLVQSIRPDGSIRFVNRAWLERLGYSEEEAATLNIFDVIHPDSHEHCMHFMQRLMAGENVGSMEVVFCTRAGEHVHLEGRASVQFEDGVPVATRGVFRETGSTGAHDSSIRRLREQRRLFHSVLSILRANTSKHREDFLGLATRKVAQALNVARASVWLFDEHRTVIRCEQLFSDGRSLGATGHVLGRNDHPQYFSAIESTIPVRADDARTHPATESFRDGYLDPLGISSMLDAPIRLGDDLAGVLCCEHTGPARHWTNDEEEFTLAVAAIVLIFLENERRVAAERQLHELNHRLEAMVRERTERLLRSEDRLRYVMTSAPTALFSCSVDGEFQSTYVSPNIERVLGYPAEAFFSGPTFWSDHIHPDDVDSAYATLQRAIELDSAGFEYRFLFPDGVYRWMRDEFVLMRDADGRPCEIVGSCVNIDDRRRAELAAEAAATDLHRLIDTANAPIFGKDINHQVNEWNRCAERITGYAKEAVLGRALTDFVVPDYRAAVKEVLDRALSGIETANFEFPIQTKDGRQVLLLLNASTRRDGEGRIVGMVGVGQDITEHRESERRSLRAQRLESIGTLSGGVAHDINNALAPILLATGALRKRYPDSRDLVDVMEASAKRGASMVQQLLTFARGVDGRRVAIHPKSVVRELENIVTSTFPKNISARFECEDGLPTVIGDSTQLHQVLLNLCVNARDSMPLGGSIDVRAHVRRLDAADVRRIGDGVEGDYVVIVVRDRGAGIPAELIERIFEPFFSTKSPEQGTGLGLSTALGIIRSHGGFMRVTSEAGVGSEFSVFLPAATVPESEDEAPPPDRAFRGNGETILIVDDEPAVRDVLRQILVGLGFRVRTAQDGRAALEVLADPTGSVAGVITDLHMPVMDGLEFTREAVRRRPGLPVILSSGRFDRRDTERFAALGVTTVLEKPFSIDRLSDALRAMFMPV